MSRQNWLMRVYPEHGAKRCHFCSVSFIILNWSCSRRGFPRTETQNTKKQQKIVKQRKQQETAGNRLNCQLCETGRKQDLILGSLAVRVHRRQRAINARSTQASAKHHPRVSMTKRARYSTCAASEERCARAGTAGLGRVYRRVAHRWYTGG